MCAPIPSDGWSGYAESALLNKRDLMYTVTVSGDWNCLRTAFIPEADQEGRSSR